MNNDLGTAFFSPEKSLLPTFLATSMAIGLAINLMSSAINPILGWVLVIVLITIAIWFRMRHRPHLLTWSEGKELNEQEYKALVTLFSNPKTIETLIKYHKGLEHIWIITNFHEKPNALFVSKKMSEYKENIKGKKHLQIHPKHFDDHRSSNIKATYEQVKAIFPEAINEYGLSPKDIVVDITSGTKEMTAGLITACVEYSWQMSYVRSEYKWDENTERSIRIDGTEVILAIETDFVPANQTP